ncbi:hypothetical protein P5V15_005135 [Pogonomyrmex californicus]
MKRGKRGRSGREEKKEATLISGRLASSRGLCTEYLNLSCDIIVHTLLRCKLIKKKKYTIHSMFFHRDEVLGSGRTVFLRDRLVARKIESCHEDSRGLSHSVRGGSKRLAKLLAKSHTALLP